MIGKVRRRIALILHMLCLILAIPILVWANDVMTTHPAPNTAESAYIWILTVCLILAGVGLGWLLNRNMAGLDQNYKRIEDGIQRLHLRCDAIEMGLKTQCTNLAKLQGEHEERCKHPH